MSEKSNLYDRDFDLWLKKSSKILPVYLTTYLKTIQPGIVKLSEKCVNTLTSQTMN